MTKQEKITIETQVLKKMFDKLMRVENLSNSDLKELKRIAKKLEMKGEELKKLNEED